VTGGFALFCIMRNGKPKPPTVTGVFLFAKMMITVRKLRTKKFLMDRSIFDGWDSIGGAHHPLTIAVYAFICHMDGCATNENIKQAFRHTIPEAVDNAILMLEVDNLITTDEQ